MNGESIIYDKNDGIAVITLNRPERRNAINTQMRDDLVAALDDAESDEQIRAVSTHGIGPQTLVSSADRVFSIIVFTLWYEAFFRESLSLN